MEEQNEDVQHQVTLNNVSFLEGDQLKEKTEKMSRDMNFFAIVYIIYGALLCLTIVGAIIGVPIIIYHLKLKDAGRSFQQFTASNDFYYLDKAIENQKKFFFFYKVLIIIGLIFFALYLIVVIYLVTEGMMPTPGDMA